MKPGYTTCFFCNIELKVTSLKKHLLDEHNKTLYENRLKRYGYEKDEDLPNCPICQKQLKLDKQGRLRNVCSRSCRVKLDMQNGTHNLLSKNRPKDKDGKSIWDKKAAQTKLTNNTLNLLPQNKPKDKNGKDIWAEKSIQTRLENNVHPWQSCNRKTNENNKDIIALKNYNNQLKNGTFQSICENITLESHILNYKNRTSEDVTHVYLYLFHDKKTKIIKIGITNNLKEHKKNLNTRTKSNFKLRSFRKLPIKEGLILEYKTHQSIPLEYKRIYNNNEWIKTDNIINEYYSDEIIHKINIMEDDTCYLL